MNFKVSKTLMNEIEHAYNNKGKPDLKIVRGYSKKLKLEPVSKLSKAILNPSNRTTTTPKIKINLDLPQDHQQEYPFLLGKIVD